MLAVSDPVPQEFITEPHQVERKLAKLLPHKASGPDNIPNWFWRDFSVWLAEPLCAIVFILSLLIIPFSN